MIQLTIRSDHRLLYQWRCSAWITIRTISRQDVAVSCSRADVKMGQKHSKMATSSPSHATGLYMHWIQRSI